MKFACYLLLINLLVVSFVLAVPGQTKQQSTSEPGPNSSLVAQAQTLITAGKIDAAIEMLKGASSATDAQVNYLLGLAYYQKSDFTRAIQHLSIGVKGMSQDSRQYRQAVQMLGLSQYLQGHLKEAIPYLEQVVNWSPNNVDIAYVLGLSYIQTQNPTKAREAFARTFNVQPNSAPAYLINAQMMIRQRFEIGRAHV